MAIVMRVQHASLGTLNFTDDEAPRMASRRVIQTLEQVSQTGNITVLNIGQIHFEFDITFELFFASTLDKLDLIWNLQDEFRLYPWLRTSPLSSFDCIWPSDTFREDFRFGLPAAQIDYGLTWKEATKGTCPEPVRS